MTALDPLGKQEFISLNGSTYCLWQNGEGPLVLLLHGWPVTSRHWERVVSSLCRSGYKVCCVDLKGLGASKIATGSFAKADIANDLLALLEIVFPRVDSMNVVGHDWGGSIALAMAKNSRKVRCLVIEEEIPPGIQVDLHEPGLSRYPSWHGGFHRTKMLAETLIKKSQNEYFDFFLGLRCSPETLSQPLRQHFLDAYAETRRLPQFLEYYRTTEADKAFFRELTRKKIKIPTLGIGGKFAMGVAVLDSLKVVADRAEFSLFEKSGHYPAEEEPENFSSRLMNFFANCD